MMKMIGNRQNIIPSPLSPTPHFLIKKRIVSLSITVYLCIIMLIPSPAVGPGLPRATDLTNLVPTIIFCLIVYCEFDVLSYLSKKEFDVLSLLLNWQNFFEVSNGMFDTYQKWYVWRLSSRHKHTLRPHLVFLSGALEFTLQPRRDLEREREH